MWTVGGSSVVGGIIAVVASERRKRTLRRRMDPRRTSRTSGAVARRIRRYNVESARGGCYMRLDIFMTLSDIAITRVPIASVGWRVAAGSVRRK